LEDLLDYLARRLVAHPDEVSVTRAERDGETVLQLRVAADDVGKVIGRHGRVVRALRTLTRASAARSGERVLLEIVEP
jgi:predicted RNA-binding protein YlqC (UPF0109 family)